MNRIWILVAWAFLAGSLPCLAQYGPITGGGAGGHEIQFRPFSVSFSTLSGYDSESSVFTSSKNEPAQSSFYAGFDASAAMNYVFSDSFFGVRSSTAYTYYFNRTRQPYNTALNLDTTFTHTFSPRWTLSVEDSFVRDTEIQVGTDTLLPNQAQRSQRYGYYYINTFNLNNSFLIAPRLTFNVGLPLTTTRYESRQAANTLDEDVYGISTGINYLLSSATSVGLSVSYSRSQHPGFTKIYSPLTNKVVVARVNRDTESETFGVPFTHAFSSRLSLGGFAGVTFTTFHGGKVIGQPGNAATSESINPNFSLSASYLVDSRTTVAVSYLHSISETDISNFQASIQDVGTVSYTRQVSSKITVNLTLQYSENAFDQQFNAATAVSTRQSGSEQSYGGTISTSYNFTTNLGLDLGYTYQAVSSVFQGRSYDRDRIIFNLRYSF